MKYPAPKTRTVVDSPPSESSNIRCMGLLGKVFRAVFRDVSGAGDRLRFDPSCRDTAS